MLQYLKNNTFKRSKSKGIIYSQSNWWNKEGLFSSVPLEMKWNEDTCWSLSPVHSMSRLLCFWRWEERKKRSSRVFRSARWLVIGRSLQLCWALLQVNPAPLTLKQLLPLASQPAGHCAGERNSNLNAHILRFSIKLWAHGYKTIMCTIPVSMPMLSACFKITWSCLRNVTTTTLTLKRVPGWRPLTVYCDSASEEFTLKTCVADCVLVL